MEPEGSSVYEYGTLLFKPKTEKVTRVWVLLFYISPNITRIKTFKEDERDGAKGTHTDQKYIQFPLENTRNEATWKTKAQMGI